MLGTSLGEFMVLNGLRGLLPAGWALLSPGHKPCCRASGGEIKDAALIALLKKWNCSVLVGKDTTHRLQNAPFKPE